MEQSLLLALLVSCSLISVVVVLEFSKPAMWHPRTPLLWYCSKLYQDLIYAMNYLAINRGKNGKKYVDWKDGEERHQWNAD